MEHAEYSTDTRRNEGIFRLVSYALVMLMMTCAAVSFSTLIHYVFPDWNASVVGALAFFTAFERLLVHARLRNLYIFSREWALLMGAQWLVLALVIRLTMSLSHGLRAFQADLASLSGGFLDYWFPPEFVIALAISIAVWSLTGSAAELLEEMGLDQTRIRREAPLLDSRYVPPRARLMSFIFTLGTALIVFTGLVRVNVREMFAFSADHPALHLNAVSSGGGTTLLYFLFGLALLSQSQFISLHTSWRLQGARINRELALRWGPYSLLFLVVLVAVVSLLPTHYGLSFLTTLGYVLDILISILFFIAQLLLSILFLLIGFLFSIFGVEAPQTELPQPPLLPEPPIGEALPQGGPGWWGLLRSILSWLLLLGIVGFALSSFLRQHSGFAQALGRIPGARWLAGAWRWLSGWFTGVRTRVASIVESGIARVRSLRRRPAGVFSNGFLSLRRLDPRQRIFHFYLAMVRRGGEKGLPRGSSQTPNEYAASLESALPAVDAEIEALTTAFADARYSRHTVAASDANLVKATWARVRDALRDLKKNRT